MPALHDSCIVYVHGADELPGALKKLARRIGVAGIISEMAKRESYAGPSQRRRLKSVKARARARKTERRAMRRAMMEQAARLSPFYRGSGDARSQGSFSWPVVGAFVRLCPPCERRLVPPRHGGRSGRITASVVRLPNGPRPHATLSRHHNGRELTGPALRERRARLDSRPSALH